MALRAWVLAILPFGIPLGLAFCTDPCGVAFALSDFSYSFSAIGRWWGAMRIWVLGAWGTSRDPPPRSPMMDVFSPTEACGHLLKFSGVIPMYQLPLCVSEKFALWSSLYCLDYKELTQMVLRLGQCECAWSFRMCMVLQIMSFNPYLSVYEGVGGVKEPGLGKSLDQRPHVVSGRARVGRPNHCVPLPLQFCHAGLNLPSKAES